MSENPKLDPATLTNEAIKAAATAHAQDETVQLIGDCLASFVAGAMFARRSLFAPVTEKVVCPNCRQAVDFEWRHRQITYGPVSGCFPGGPYTCQPAQPEPAETVDTMDEQIAYARSICNKPEPDAPGEMPEAVRIDKDFCPVCEAFSSTYDEEPMFPEMPYELEAAIARLNEARFFHVANDVVAWWRTHSTAQPVAVGMSGALERVLDCAEMDANRDRMGGHETTAKRTMSAIREVRQQAAQAKRKVELPKVREAFDDARSLCRYLADQPPYGTDIQRVLRKIAAAFAELDAAKGRE